MKLFDTLVTLSMSVAISAAPAVADDASAFQSATKVSAIKKIGAQQMSGDSIRKIVSGNTLQHPDWTWTFRKNGTQYSDAKDGSWKTTGTWKIDGNEICRTNDKTGVEKCGAVYFLGRDIKITKGGKRNLEEWYASF